MIDIDHLPSYKITLTENGIKSIINMLEKTNTPMFYIDATSDQNGCALWIKPEIYADKKGKKKKKNDNKSTDTGNITTEITLKYRFSRENGLELVESVAENAYNNPESEINEKNHIIKFIISEQFQKLYFNTESIKIDAKGLNKKNFKILFPKPIIKNVCISE